MRRKGRPRQPRKPKEFKGLKVAPEISSLASEIIEKRHSHLMGKHIEYAFKFGSWKSRGQEIWYKARVVGGEACYLYWLPQLSKTTFMPGEERQPEKFFLVILHKGTWDMMAPLQREACLDEALCHCFVTDQGEPTITDPTQRIVLANVNTYGLWHEGLRKIASRTKDLYQGELPFQDELVETGEPLTHIGEVIDSLQTEAA